MDWLAYLFMGLSAVAGAYTQIQAGKTQKQTAELNSEYQQQQAAAQATQAARNAEFAIYQMEVEERQAEVKKRTLKTTALDLMAKARMKKGISSDSGTLLDDEIRSIQYLGQDLETIDWETDIAKANIQKQKEGYEYTGELARKQGEWAETIGDFTGSQAVKSSRYAAGTSLLAGGAQMYNLQANRGYNSRLLAALEAR